LSPRSSDTRFPVRFEGVADDVDTRDDSVEERRHVVERHQQVECRKRYYVLLELLDVDRDSRQVCG